eukprot:1952225-Rhodomonas_salina.3
MGRLGQLLPRPSAPPFPVGLVPCPSPSSLFYGGVRPVASLFLPSQPGGCEAQHAAMQQGAKIAAACSLVAIRYVSVGHRIPGASAENAEVP